MGRITREIPLLAHVTMASFSLSFVFMLLIIFASGCMLCVCWGLFPLSGCLYVQLSVSCRLLGLLVGGV